MKSLVGFMNDEQQIICVICCCKFTPVHDEMECDLCNRGEDPSIGFEHEYDEWE